MINNEDSINEIYIDYEKRKVLRKKKAMLLSPMSDNDSNVLIIILFLCITIVSFLLTC